MKLLGPENERSAQLHQLFEKQLAAMQNTQDSVDPEAPKIDLTHANQFVGYQSEDVKVSSRFFLYEDFAQFLIILHEFFIHRWQWRQFRVAFIFCCQPRTQAVTLKSSSVS